MKIKLFYLLAITFSSLLVTNCDDDNDLLMSYNIELKFENEIPIVTNRDESGTIEMSLFEDNTLTFTIMVNNLSGSDVLTNAHIHTGDVVSTGGVAIVLVDGTDIAFSGNMASGTIQLTSSQASILQGSDVYVNVHSTEVPSGLVRGQIDQVIDNAYNVVLSPDNEIPPVTGRSETGNAYFRLVSSMLYYKIIVNDLDETDAITAGHIHEGSATEENGDIFLNLEITDNAQLDVTKNLTLNTTELTKINTDELYVNIHSNQAGSGLLRGQIR